MTKAFTENLTGIALCDAADVETWTKYGVAMPQYMRCFTR
jgi:hypothetical protein